MEQANVARVLFTLLMAMAGFKVGSVAVAVWLDALWPDYVRRMNALYSQRAGRCVLSGVVNVVLGGIVSLLLLNFKPLGLLGLLLLGCLAALWIAGCGCAYSVMGARLFPPETSSPRWKQIISGGVVVELLAPVLGQLFSIGVFFRGLGAAVLAMVGRGTTTHVDTPAGE